MPLFGSENFNANDRTAPCQDGCSFLELIVFGNHNQHGFLDGVFCGCVIAHQRPRIGHEFFPAFECRPQYAITPLLFDRPLVPFS
jgi:hypothetical protein